MVITRFGRSAKGGACTCPCIDEEASEVSLIACSGQQGTHAGKSALAGKTVIVGVGRVDDLRTQVESLESFFFVAGNEEFMSITQGVAERLVSEFVVSGTDEAGAYLSRLMMAEHALIG